jgi:ATP-dependent DNA helicase RecG
MDANERKLKELIRKGEGISTEFKTCRNSLGRDVYETVCAFLPPSICPTPSILKARVD